MLIIHGTINQLSHQSQPKDKTS